mmetsp:Transcript_11182/g.32198  ORF Transcript_11182/g.32198 Transcript_11182/m.32198 type:complete len:356 (-) Transcript_11182:105-1172(-)
MLAVAVATAIIKSSHAAILASAAAATASTITVAATAWRTAETTILPVVSTAAFMRPVRMARFIQRSSLRSCRAGAFASVATTIAISTPAIATASASTPAGALRSAPTLPVALFARAVGIVTSMMLGLLLAFLMMFVALLFLVLLGTLLSFLVPIVIAAIGIVNRSQHPIVELLLLLSARLKCPLRLGDMEHRVFNSDAEVLVAFLDGWFHIPHSVIHRRCRRLLVLVSLWLVGGRRFCHARHDVVDPLLRSAVIKVPLHGAVSHKLFAQQEFLPSFLVILLRQFATRTFLVHPIDAAIANHPFLLPARRGDAIELVLLSLLLDLLGQLLHLSLLRLLLLLGHPDLLLVGDVLGVP